MPDGKPESGGRDLPPPPLGKTSHVLCRRLTGYKNRLLPFSLNKTAMFLFYRAITYRYNADLFI